MTMLMRNEIVVRCTPEEAFEFLSDMRNELIWNEGYCKSVEKLTEGPVEIGTRYRAKWKGSPTIEVEYTDFKYPLSWRAHSDGAMESNFQCAIEPHEDGAKILSELELIPHGIFKLLFPLFRGSFKKHEKGAKEKIRTTINERYAGAQPKAG